MTSHLITRAAAPTLLQQIPIPAASPHLQPLPLRYSGREPIRHLLIGSPPLVQTTIHNPTKSLANRPPTPKFGGAEPLKVPQNWGI